MPAETHSRRGALGPDDVTRIVAEQLALVLELDDLPADPATRLRDDLGADDLQLLDLAEAIEQELGERTVGFRLDDEELAELVTVGDLVACVVALVVPGDDA